MVVKEIRTKCAVIRIMDDYCKDRTEAEVNEILNRIARNCRPVERPEE